MIDTLFAVLPTHKIHLIKNLRATARLSGL